MAEFIAQLKQAAWGTKTLVKETIQSTYWPARPHSLMFEITSVCDARCIHCPRQEMDRPVKPMDFALFQRMIDQAAALKIPELLPNGYGEILTLPKLTAYLDYIASKEHKFRIIINTNGHLMTEEKIELFLKHQIYLLNITIDGATKETAESVRVGLKMDRIEKNIHRLLALRKARGLRYPKIRTGMVLIPQNEHEAKLFVKKWTGVADYVGLAGMSNRVGGLGAAVNHSSGRTAVCVLPFRDMNVWADGKVVLCCHDWNEERVVGDLQRQTLQEIWLGPAFTKARRLHQQGKGHEIGICAKCNIWLAPSRGARLWS